VELSSGALTDLSGNPFEGLAGQAGWSFTTALESQIKIHEPFDYTVTGTTDGDDSYLGDGNQNGGIGFDGAWTQQINNIEMEVLTPGLSFTDGGGDVVPVSGNKALRTSRSGFVAASRPVSASATASLTADNSTMWMSFLYEKPSALDGLTADSAVMFASTEPALANDHSLSSTGYGVGIVVEDVGGSGPQYVSTGYYNGTTAVTKTASSFQPEDDAVYLVAAKINWKEDGTPDEIFVFNITDITSEPAEIDAIASATFDMTLADQQSLDVLNVTETQTNAMDEIRIGTGFADIMGNNIPADSFDAYISDPAFGLDPAEQGFGQDPDGDNLANGLEAWFGTHPGEFNPGLAGLTTDGATTTFTHPQNENRPSDVIGFYEWSPNLVDWYAGDGVDGPVGGPRVTFMAQTAGAVTTVTATTAGSAPHLFFRAGVAQLP
jgi:hypothetical protein